MNVLIVHPCKGFYGGAEEVVVQLCKYLITGGHGVTTVLKDAPEKLMSTCEGLRHPTESWLEFRKAAQSKLEWADVVNVHNAPAPLTTFPRRVPTVYMCNEPMEMFTTWWRKPIEAFNRWWVKKSDMKIVVADDYNKQRFQALYKVEPSIVPYGVNYDFWSQPVDTSKPKDGKVRILHVGTITPYKNQLKSIHVLSELLASGVDATLSFAGAPTDLKYWASLLQEHIPTVEEKCPGLAERVVWYGQCTQEQIRILYHQHDVLFHPVEKQGGWLVPFEALCAGLPVITTTEFPAASLVRKTGMLVSLPEPEEIAKVIKTVIANYDNFADNEKIKLWLKENLSWEKFGEGMVKTFEEAISERKST